VVIAGEVGLPGAIGGPGLAAVFEPAERHAVRALSDAATRDCCSCWRPGPGEATPAPATTSDTLKRGRRFPDYSARMGRPLIGQATWSASGEDERLWFVGTLATIRVPGEAVVGRYALIEFPPSRCRIHVSTHG
jgi:hypothetical protein